MTTTTPAAESAAAAPETKIVIVSGQEFSVPATATIDELRTHLASMFPEVASATVQKGTKTIDGIAYETIEFVKRAGTKGAANLAPLLAEIPPLRLSPPRTATIALLESLRAQSCTIVAALDADLPTILATMPESSLRISGATLCAQLDSLPPVAVDDEVAW